MKAKDIMTAGAVTVSPDTGIDVIAGMLLERRISAVVVVDGVGRPLGIVSEGDLIQRVETGTEPKRSWWLEMVQSPESRALDYVRTHGRKASDVMSRPVVTIGEDLGLREIAALLEEKRIKRVPVVRDGRVVGIVSRADLLRGLVTARVEPATGDEDAIRDGILDRIRNDAGIPSGLLNVTVSGGEVHLWGMVDNAAERKAVVVVAENTPGVTAVVDHLRVARI